MMPHVTGPVLSPAVAAAIRADAPVVALESTLLAHGLPAPRNREVADELESAAERMAACSQPAQEDRAWTEAVAVASPAWAAHAGCRRGNHYPAVSRAD